MGTVRKLVLRELAEGSDRFWQCWYSAVPPEGSSYRVTEEEWTAGEEGGNFPVRHIFSWELLRGPEG